MMGGEGMLQKRIRKEHRRELSHKEETRLCDWGIKEVVKDRLERKKKM